MYSHELRSRQRENPSMSPSSGCGLSSMLIESSENASDFGSVHSYNSPLYFANLVAIERFGNGISPVNNNSPRRPRIYNQEKEQLIMSENGDTGSSQTSQL